MKKVIVGGAGDIPPAERLADPATTILKSCPALVAHCTATRYEDGSPRRPGWFTVKTMGSAWVVQVKDPDSCASMSVTSQTLDDALQMTELLIGSDGAPWEPDPFLKRWGGSKK